MAPSTLQERHALTAAPKGSLGLQTYAYIVLALPLLYLAATAIYNIWFHPLSKFPGPKHAVVSNFFYSKAVSSGNSTKIVCALHEKYGDVVRWGPNELSFASAPAWKDVYERRKDDKILIKDLLFYRTDDTVRAKHIISTSDPEEHAQMRKMSHAFSSAAILKQEDAIIRYADDLMLAIREKGEQGPINLVEFFNWMIFDVLGELAFGANRKTSDWIAIILDSIKFNAYDVAIWKLPVVPRFQWWLTPKAVRNGGIKHAYESKDKILKRAEKGMVDGKRDFVSYIVDKRDELRITDWEMAAHSNALIVAGSETTATILSGLFYYLLTCPAVYAKLKEEVRSRFSRSEEVNARAATLPYLTATIDESLRI